MSKTFCLGIDLGTSNSAIAYGDPEGEGSEIIEVTQVLSANTLGTKQTFPSATYLPHADEFGEGGVKLPWEDHAPSQLRGQFARDHGALIPDRLITSAKSWLSNPHVDPSSPVLPWGSDLPKDQKLSASAVSRGYLEHLKHAFLHSTTAAEKGLNFEEGEVVVTVPASFDEVARNLTLDAAREAGLGDVVLLEEPQAAFYAWTAQNGSDWRKQVQSGDVILVCDVGGGTADFSLLAMAEREGNLEIERISVGEHLLLGGDNMDLALAYTVQAQLNAEGTNLDSWQFLSLIHGCRKAKEELFARDDLDEASIAIPSRGSSLFAKSISAKLSKATLQQVVLDGFMPKTPVTELPQETSRSGLQEFGLPYASDPVVSKHLARFLTRSLMNVESSDSLKAALGGNEEALNGGYLKPNAVLFNGGVFKSGAARRRIIELLASWNDGKEPKELEGFQPDLAVAHGAAVYARNRVSGKGLRIKAGTARSYYIGLETSMPAIPGFKPPLKAVCVVPQGMEEGSEEKLEERDFGLITGQEATFRFLSSEVRGGDAPGSIVDNAEAELEETSSLTVTLPSLPDHPDGQMIPVNLRALVTELGNLELWMQHTASDKEWKLDFKVRTE